MKKAALIVSLVMLMADAWADKAPPLRANYSPEEIATGIYVIHGPEGKPNPENQGFMNNPGFVLTDAGVVVIDPGSSVQVGEMVLEKIKGITDKPVVAVFDTHVHGDHWLGNQAIHQAYPDAAIYGHPLMIEKVKQGTGDSWIDLMMNRTDGATAGTVVVNATQPVDQGDTMTIGGTSFAVLHNGKAHTQTDIMIHVVERGVIFLGDNSAYGVFIRMSDGNFAGNIAALNIALESGATVFVPGHGKTGGLRVASEFRDYLQTVLDGVQQYYAEDLSDFEIKPKLLPRLSAWKGWKGFDDEVGKHIGIAYLEVESADF